MTERFEVPAAVDGPAGVHWGRTVERLCFLLPPVVGIGVIGVIGELDPGLPGLETALVLVASIGYTVVSVALAAAMYLDARGIRRHTAWGPSPAGNALGALVLAPAAGPVYLYRRYRHVAPPPAWDGWWLVVAVSLIATVLGALGTIAGTVLLVPGLVLSSAGIAAAIAIGTFPVAIHQDAAHVWRAEGAWSPNPGGYLGLAFLSLLVPPLQVLLAAWYLGRRNRSVGLGTPTWPLAG